MPGNVPIVGDYLQVRVHCQANDQLSLNVLHYQVTAVAGGGLSLNSIAGQLSAAFATAYKAWLPATATYDFTSVQNISPPISNPWTSNSGAGVGASTGGLLPRQSSGLIRHITSMGGRSNRGRSYIGFIAGVNVDTSGELTGGGTALLTAIGNAIGPVLTPTVGAASVTLQLVVRHPDLVGPPTAPVGTPVNVVTASGLIATQRRRGDYGQQNPS